MYFNLSVHDVSKNHSIVNDRFGLHKKECMYMYVSLNYMIAVHVHVAAAEFFFHSAIQLELDTDTNYKTSIVSCYYDGGETPTALDSYFIFVQGTVSTTRVLTILFVVQQNGPKLNFDL